MTTILKLLNNPYVLGVLLLCGAIIDLVLLGREFDLSKSDWGTWVGSIGTVATLAGTIWLATNSERKRNREQLDLAIIAAAEIVFWTYTMQGALRRCADMLPMTRNGDFGEIFEDCYEQIQAVGIPRTVTLKDLVVVRGHAAANLAFTATRIRAISSAFIEYKNTQLVTLGDVHEAETALNTRLIIAIEELKEPQRLCEEFLSKHSFYNTPLL